MLVYPQLPTGALVQFPTQRRQKLRTILTTVTDGTAIKLGDPGAAILEWQLKYAGLSDVELAALQQFFLAAEGTLNEFIFVDPTANLLAWSNDLTNVAWDAAPLLSVSGQFSDPAGGTAAWQLANSAAASQGLAQTLTAPGGHLYCLSVYARTSGVGNLTLVAGNNRLTQQLRTKWQRFACTGSGDPTSSSITFGLEVDAGAVIEIYGIQVESQGSPSALKVSTTGGCYENARLRDDTFTFATTDVNRHSATVNILYASHL